MKLELKHLAPYLPYGLTGLWINGKNRIYKVTNICVAGDGNISLGHSLKTRYKHEINRPLSEFKPLLIPMSEFKHQDLVNISEYLYGQERDWFPNGINAAINMLQSNLNQHNYDVTKLPYFIAIDFFYRHFDVFSLIPAGLALNKLEHG